MQYENSVEKIKSPGKKLRRTRPIVRNYDKKIK